MFRCHCMRQNPAWSAWHCGFLKCMMRHRDRCAWNKIPMTRVYGTCSSIIPIRPQIHSLVKMYSLLIVLMQITHAMLHQSDSAANEVPTHCPRQDKLIFKSYVNESAYLHVEVQTFTPWLADDVFFYFTYWIFLHTFKNAMFDAWMISS